MRAFVRFALGVALLLSALSPGLALGAWFAWSGGGPSPQRTAVVLGTLAIVGFLAFLICIGLWSAQTPEELELTESHREDSQLLSFLTAYSIPLALAALETSGSARISAAVVGAFLALVYLRGRMFHLNPLFVLAGFRLYECGTKEQGTVYVLTGAPFMKQTGLLLPRRVVNGVYIELGVVHDRARERG